MLATADLRIDSGAALSYLAAMMRIRWLLVAVGLTLLLSLGGLTPLQAQYMEPTRLKLGGSLGAGGTHLFFKPAFDLHYGPGTLTLSPGLWFLSAGIRYQLGYYKKRMRISRPIYLSASYHNDWWLANVRRRAEGSRRIRDVQVFSLVTGIRANLYFTGLHFVEFGVGMCMAREAYRPVDDFQPPPRWFPLPMVEARWGLLIINRKYHKQKLSGVKK
jgi:hypothetical protein